MTRRLAIVLTLVAVLAVTVPTSADAATKVKTRAKFTVTLETTTKRFDFRQSPFVESTLDGTPQVPVSLHAAPKSDPFAEFVLAGVAKNGTQQTSGELVLALNVEVGEQSMLLSSDDGDCTVNIKTLTNSRIVGSFTCETRYGSDDVTARGTFRAK